MDSILRGILNMGVGGGQPRMGLAKFKFFLLDLILDTTLSHWLDELEY